MIVPLITVSLFLFSAIFGQQVSRAEVYQLNTVDRIEKSTDFDDISADRLLEKEKGKKFILMFLRANPAEKLTMCSNKYRKKILDGAHFKNIFNKESYDRIAIHELKISAPEKTMQMNIKADLYWFLEGLEGVQTFYFTLVKEKDAWLLDWIVY
jgi:hypothetical protein